MSLALFKKNIEANRPWFSNIICFSVDRKLRLWSSVDGHILDHRGTPSSGDRPFAHIFVSVVRSQQGQCAGFYVH